MSAIGSLASTLLHAVLPINLFPTNTTASTTASTGPTVQQPDTGQLSTFAQLANTLQRLQQSNPVEYTQVTQKIAANLQSAAQTAQASGNTTGATQLNKLSADFINASATGQLPNLQDLAHAAGHHGHRSAVSQLLSSVQSGTSQVTSTKAASIIQSTLTSAGIATSNV